MERFIAAVDTALWIAEKLARANNVEVDTDPRWIRLNTWVSQLEDDELPPRVAPEMILPELKAYVKEVLL